ncbi:MAG: ABC-type amino acid transport substrate-binding protein [Enterobacterales bacterium]|jgi:ABC-type amino acid transport substrate-binding protein
MLDGVMLIALPGKGIIINSIEDFKDLTIGAPSGISVNTPVIDSSIYKVEFSNGNIFGLRMLDQKRIDVYVETNVSIAAVA